MTDFINDEKLVLKIAQKLCDNGFLRKKEGFFQSKVHYTRRYPQEIEFDVASNDLWDDSELADVIVDAFNRYGFKSRTVDTWSVVLVRVEPFMTDLEVEVDDCFKKVME